MRQHIVPAWNAIVVTGSKNEVGISAPPCFVMTFTPASTYAAALNSGNKASGVTTTPAQASIPQHPQSALPAVSRPFSTQSALDEQHQYQPRTKSPETTSYVLTFLTSKVHHDTLTSLRQNYFPAHLNHLDAHLTLFHALPGSELDTVIIPTLESTAKTATKFYILASTPFQLRKGIAIGIPKSAGGDTARSIHSSLRSQWMSFLSEQDRGGFQPHYTIMNKVNDAKQVDQAFKEVQKDFKAVKGTVEGLSLWRYCDGGTWEHERDFEFSSNP